MKAVNRTKSKNVTSATVWGIIARIVMLIIPFFVRTVFIRILGIEYLGLNSLFSSVLNVLNLAELGIDSAVVFMMYKAVAENDKESICRYLNFIRKAYFYVGVVLLILGILIIPFFPWIISGSSPEDVNIYCVYFIQLLNTILPYFIFSYKRAIFQANQRGDLLYIITIVASFFQYGLQVVAILLVKNYYAYVITSVLTTLFSNFLLFIISKKYYPDYKPSGKLFFNESQVISKKIKALFFYKIGTILLNYVDAIVISSFLGLTILGQYNNYYYIINALFGLITVLGTALTPTIGNLVSTSSSSNNKQLFDILNFFIYWMMSWATICLFCLYQPFITIWLGQQYLRPAGITASLSIEFYFWKIMLVVSIYKDAAGIWEYDKFRPLFAAIVNLILNIILVQFIGLYGIVWSTIISLIFVINPWSIYVLFKHYFKIGLKQFLLRYVYNILVTFFAGVITYGICLLFSADSITYFLTKVGICIIVPNVVIICLYSLDPLFIKSLYYLTGKIRGVRYGKQE